MESLLFPIIMLAVTLIGGGILLLFLKTSKKTPQTDAGSTVSLNSTAVHQCQGHSG